MKLKQERIALFGGSFDPVHRAHLAIAKESFAQCDLDRVIFIPCPQSPHKDEAPSASASQRVEMLRLATADLPWTEVSTWELERSEDSPAYSWITASHFAEALPEARLFWIAGSDQWNKIDKWSRPEVLARLLTFIVFPRGAPPEPQEGFHYKSIDYSIEGSSTAARGLLARGENAVDLIPESVHEYILERNLYRPAAH